jgi:hypothetical protein
VPDLDFALTTYGDLVVGPDGDLLLLGEPGAIRRQRMVTTLLVNAPDHDLFPAFGANLEDLIGRPLDETTYQLARELIREAVPEVREVTVVPDHERNALLLVVDHPDHPDPLLLTFALDGGLMVPGGGAENLLHEAFLEA